MSDCWNLHIRHLRIRWQDRITNEEVLQRAQMTSLEAMLIKAQLKWSGHVLRMDDFWLPKRSPGGQYLRYKDRLKRCLNKCNISLIDWRSKQDTDQFGEVSFMTESTTSRLTDTATHRDGDGKEVPEVENHRPRRISNSAVEIRVV